MIQVISKSPHIPARTRTGVLPTLALVVLILWVAAAVRLHEVADRPVWTDEGWTIWAASDNQLTSVIDTMAADRHPPLYFLGLSTWRQVAGPSHLSLRFFSIMAGLLTVAATYRIAADWWGHRTGRVTAAVLAILDMAVYYTQEIRDYGWLMFAVTLMTLFFLRYLRKPEPRRAMWIALSVAFMLYTLYLGALVLAVHGVIGVFVWRGTLRQKAGLVLAWACAGVLFLPWLIVMITRQLDYVNVGIGGFPGSIDTAWSTLPDVAELFFGTQMALLGGAYTLGAFSVWRERSSLLRLNVGLTLVVSGIGLLLLMVVVNVWYGLLAARMVSFLVPFVALIAAKGFVTLDRHVMIVLLAAWLATTAVTPQQIQPRLRSDNAAQVLAGAYSPGDLVILETGWDDNAFHYELMRALPDNNPAIIRTLPWVADPGTAIPVIPQVENTVASHRRVWVVQWLQPSALMPWLEEGHLGFRRVLAFDVPVGAEYEDRYPEHPVIQVVLYERPDLDAERVVFGGKLALVDAVLADTIAPSQALHVDLWWTALEPLPLDYSVGLYVMPLATDSVSAQADASPQPPTSTWEPENIIFDRHTVYLRRELPPGEYRIMASVYWYGDGQPLPSAEGTLVELDHITLRAP